MSAAQFAGWRLELSGAAYERLLMHTNGLRSKPLQLAFKPLESRGATTMVTNVCMWCDMLAI